VAVVVVVVVAACGRVGFDPAASPSDAEPVACSTTAIQQHFRSVGVATGDLFAAGIASVDAGQCLVTFSNTLPDTVGKGDAIELDGTQLFTRARIDDTHLTLEEPAPATLGGAFTIHRAFNAFDAWEAARGGDLVGQERTEIAVAYADAPFLFTDPVAIQGSTTDAQHFMRVIAGPRHHGKVGGGVVLDGQRIACDAFDVFDPFTRIEHLELVRFAPENACGPAGVIVRGTGARIDSLLVHDYATVTGNGASAVRLTNAGGASATIVNTIAFDGRNGVRAPVNANGQITVENCTFGQMTESGVALEPNGGSMTVTNSIAVGTLDTAFRDSNSAMTQSNNISGDDSAAGPGAITNGKGDALFESATDFHLIAGALAIDAGVDLDNVGVDIDEQQRPAGAWDIGADER